MSMVVGGGLAYRCRIAARFSLLLVTGVLAGCVAVDQYSERAVEYNLEAEQALDQGLLLNVIRASKRRPMQFSSVQSISGTATASGSAGLTVPFGAGGASYKMGALGAGLSGGPTFNVPILDTQEFYQGVMTPISGQLFDYFNAVDLHAIDRGNPVFPWRGRAT
jgi:hypothetical protein